MRPARLLSQAAEQLRQKASNLLEQLTLFYDEMDRHYAAAAAHYGLECRGCAQSCCLTRFYHHTLLEYAALWEGVRPLDAQTRSNLRERALAYRRALTGADQQAALFRHPCPLEAEGRCRLYTRRPMICRLHGVPHTLRHPAKGLITGPGCHACRKPAKPDRPLDRTPIYEALAGLEQSARLTVGFNQPLRLTVADMILAMPLSSDASAHDSGKDQCDRISEALRPKGPLR